MPSKLFKQLCDLSADDLNEVGNDVLFLLAEKANGEDYDTDTEANDNYRTHMRASHEISIPLDAELILATTRCPWRPDAQARPVHAALVKAGSKGTTRRALEAQFGKRCGHATVLNHLRWLYVWGRYLKIDGVFYGKADFATRPYEADGGLDASAHV